MYNLRRRGFHWHIGIVCLTLSMFVAACGGSGATAGTSKASTSSPSGGTSSDCTASNVIVNGINTESFCGSAKAQATYQGQPYTWTQGACFNQPEGTGVNIGHEVLDAADSAAGNALKKQYDYFGAEAQASKDGTYDGVLASFYHGIDMTASGAVTFSNNLQAGSFTGKTIIGRVAITASWTCA